MLPQLSSLKKQQQDELNKSFNEFMQEVFEYETHPDMLANNNSVIASKRGY